MSDTIFDKILSGDIPADKVYEDDFVLAFNDINPQAPVHVLVIPKKKIARYSDLDQWSEDYAGEFFQRVSQIAGKLGLDNGYRVVINNGPNAGQEVEYLHAHILGGRRLSWPPG